MGDINNQHTCCRPKKLAASVIRLRENEICLNILEGGHTDVGDELVDELGDAPGDELEDLADEEETLIGQFHG
jgi:hypothetical protein